MAHLNTIVGFLSLVLILSLVVTALAQLTQGVFRLRSRNLFYGLRIVLKSLRDDKTKDVSELNTRTVLLHPQFSPSLNKKNAARKVFANRDITVTWLDPVKLGEVIAEAPTDLTPEQRDNTVLEFAKLEVWLSNRFARTMRGVSLFWAFSIAMIYQLSVPAVLADFSVYERLQVKPVINGAVALNTGAKSGAMKDPGSLVSKVGIIKPCSTDYRPFSVKLWRDADFYWGKGFSQSLHNFLGVCMMAVFLSLGAPFWFEQLKNVASLKDAFQGT